ncbi:hypothetical protein Ddc_11487 [Ditylenchus destructor]|nr:hypothetical protein Ddc_11487 [Ditylenchus destructor]
MGWQQRLARSDRRWGGKEHSGVDSNHTTAVALSGTQSKPRKQYNHFSVTPEIQLQHDKDRAGVHISSGNAKHPSLEPTERKKRLCNGHMRRGMRQIGANLAFPQTLYRCDTHSDTPSLSHCAVRMATGKCQSE